MPARHLEPDGTNPVVTLGVLNVVESNSTVTQRSISTQLGIALGLTNTYLKRCIRKGYIKVSQIPTRRYAYYLTPRGFAEKSRLMAEYFSQSFQFFREARTQCAAILGTCTAQSWRRVALLGAGDLCDIARLCAHETKIEIIGIVDRDAAGTVPATLPVVSELAQLQDIDAAIVTDLRNPHVAYQEAARVLSSERIFMPGLLGLAPPAVKAVP
jgi:DNA-binding MarR family transcriptional regulator